jgi:hypothetical protein
MKKVSISEAKNRLSALIDSIKGGSPCQIAVYESGSQGMDSARHGAKGLRTAAKPRQSPATSSIQKSNGWPVPIIPCSPD